MEEAVTFLIIDDEEKNIAALARMIPKLSPTSPIIVARDGAEGWDEINKLKRRMIIFCGSTISKINYLQLLKMIKSSDKLSDYYFVVVTTTVDSEQNIKLFQMGADEILKKPFSIDEIIAKIRNALRKTLLNDNIQLEKSKSVELRQILDQDIESIKKILIKVQELRMPGFREKLETVAGSAQWIIPHLGKTEEEEIRQITYAAWLSLIGRLYLNDDMINKPVIDDGVIKNEMLRQIPVHARDIAMNIRGYKMAADILFHVYENYDGSGFPDKLKSWQIPLGSRLIRVALDYFDLLSRFNDLQGKAIDELYHEGKKLYDFRIVALFDQYLAATSFAKGRTREVPVSPKDLKNGMVVTRTVVTEAGIRILSSGVMINNDLISKLQAIHNQDPVLGNIYIREV